MELLRRINLEGIELSPSLLEKAKANPGDQEVVQFIATERSEKTRRMVEQLERALLERENTGKVTPPGKQARSRVAVCELCRQAIAIRKEDAVPPIHAGLFDSINERSDMPAFLPGATWMWLVCPFCRRRPWSSPDLVLCSDGYYHLLTEEEIEAKKLEAAEVSEQKEKEKS